MTNRNVSASLSITGFVAAALPNSIAGLNRRLADLKNSQRADRLESRALTGQLKELTQGSEEYASGPSEASSGQDAHQ